MILSTKLGGKLGDNDIDDTVNYTLGGKLGGNDIDDTVGVRTSFSTCNVAKYYYSESSQLGDTTL